MFFSKKFHILKIFSIAFGAILFSGCTHIALAQSNKLIGYIPSYRGMTAVADATDLTKLTHINIAFMNPNGSGAIASGINPVCMSNAAGGNVAGSEISYVVNKAHNAGVKVLVSFAGGGIPACSGNWQSLLSSGSRQALVNNIVQFVNAANLDGVDIDIEGDLLTSIDNAGNYTPFIQALRNSLPAGKLITAATATYNGGMIPVSSIPYFDFVNIMSYDAVGPSWGVAGDEHSSYAKAVSDINTWISRGLPKSKLILGVPFYGYGFGGMPSSISFADIVNQYGVAAAQNDVIGTRCAGCAYITYNGIPTIRNKTQLAMQQGAGVMVWELSQDATGSNSLLTTIRTQMGTVTQPTGVVSLYQNCNYGGYSASLNEGSYTLSQLNALGIANDDISSLKVQAGYKITLYNDNNFAGSSIVKTADTSCLVADNFNDMVSSVVIAKVATSWSTTIEAENFSNMSGVQTEACSEGGSNVGWIDAGDWMAYINIAIPTTGSYRIDYRVASVSGANLASNLNTNAIQFPAVTIPATGGWQNWTTVSQTVTINAGTYTFGIYAPTGGWNINWIKFTKL